MRRILSGFRLGNVHAVIGLASIAGLAFCPATVQANSAYDLELSPYAQVLAAVDDAHDGTISMTDMMSIIMDASWDNPNLRIRARNKPAFMLINNSTTPTSEITSLSITIANNNTFNFGDGDMAMDNFTGYVRSNVMFNDPGVSIVGTSLADGGKTLNVNFAGLTVGKRVLFNADFDTTSGFPYPDFRTILFGAPGVPGELPGTPASYTVNFDTPSASITKDFPQMTDTLTYASNNIRPYSFMDMVEHLNVTGQVPEPSAAVLSALGITALAAIRRRAQV
jgi:hypothetical protein